MEKIVFESTRDDTTGRMKKIKRFLASLSHAFIAFGFYQVAVEHGLLADGIQMLLDMLLPTGFLMVSDKLFMELAATDLMIWNLVTLRLFNGFLQKDEDLHALLVVMGMDGLAAGRSIIRVSSKARMNRRESQLSTLSADDTVFLKEVGRDVLQEIKGLKMDKKALQKKNLELRQRLEGLGLMKYGEVVAQEQKGRRGSVRRGSVTFNLENDAPASSEKVADEKVADVAAEMNFRF